MNGSLGFIFVVGIIGLCICLPASFSVVLSPSDSVLFGGAGGEEIRGWDWRRRGYQAFVGVLVEQLPESSAGGNEAGTATHAFLTRTPVPSGCWSRFCFSSILARNIGWLLMRT